MFARRVSIQLKPGLGSKFTQTLEKEIIPMLRKQKGFQDEIAFIGSSGRDAIGISLWDLKENADAYTRGTYPAVLKALEPLVDGTPEVYTYEVCHSTFHKILAPVPV